MTHARGRNKPDIDRILEEYDPATFEQRQRKALAKVHEAGLIERLTPEPAGRLAEERPVTKPARPAARRRWPTTWLVVLGCVGVMLTAMLAAVLVVTARAKEAADKAAAMMSAAAMAPAVTAAPIATAAPTARVAPIAVPSAAALPPPSAQPRRLLPVKPHEPREAPSAAVPAPPPPPTAEPTATPPQTEIRF